jgi:phosphoribosylamine--glycine ligase
MNTKTGKKILIIGSSSTEYAIAKKFSESDDISEIFVAPGNNAMEDFCKIIDIREYNVKELLEFVLENAIDLTIAVSETAIKNDIASFFQANNQMIFAPAMESANICLSKSYGKKFMYKNRISCPKFRIFDKPSLAIEYIINSDMPVVIKTDEHQEKNVLLCNAKSVAKTFIEKLFERGEKKVIIENYILGHEFSFYVITDGYHTLPLGSVASYKSNIEGNEGLITKGMGAITPDYKISNKIEQKILHQIIYPALNNLEKQQTPYVGILGVDLIMTSTEHLFALEFNSFLQEPDAQVILEILNENLYQLFQACVIGSFTDDYAKLNIEDKYAVSCVILSNKKNAVISGLKDLDEHTKIVHFQTKKNMDSEYETIGEKAISITRSARVPSKVIKDLYDEIKLINFEGMEFRKDIGQIY